VQSNKTWRSGILDFRICPSSGVRKFVADYIPPVRPRNADGHGTYPSQKLVTFLNKNNLFNSLNVTPYNIMCNLAIS
jgi:hypothetical protein